MRRQVFQGRRCYVVKEPLAADYHWFQEEEFAILEMLDGQTSLDELRQRLEQQFPDLETSPDHLWQFVGVLHQANLLMSDAPGQGTPLSERGGKRRRREWLTRWGGILAIRFRGVDPDRTLNRIYPWVRWLFHPAALATAGFLVLAAALLVLTQLDVFYRRLPAFHDFFSLGNIGWLLLAVAGSKILHELGHALTCKHFGGECREIGVLLLVFTPCLYCNVSDSWLMPNKWHRIAIGAAGMVVELVLAALCTFGWWFSEPGGLHYLCLYVMFMSSVNALVLNGNPLLRFDGYYILSDLAEVPNLRQKAFDELRQAILHWFGLTAKRNDDTPARRRRLLMAYGVAAGVYSWFVFALILWFLSRVFRPYRLEVLGQLLAVAALVGLIAVPFYRLGRFFHLPGKTYDMNKKRLALTGGLTLAAATALLAIPLPYRVVCPVEINVQGAATVYVESPGVLEAVDVTPSQWVQTGDRLAVLRDHDLELRLARLQKRHSELSAQLIALTQQSFADPLALAESQRVRETLHSVAKQLDERQLEFSRLTLRAPRNGRILPPPPKAAPPAGENAPRNWHGTPLERHNIGCKLESQVLFCRIGDPQNIEATLAINQSELEFVEKGLPVDLKLDELPGVTFTGVIDSISASRLECANATFSSKAGGELATRTDSSGRERPQDASYPARVSFTTDNADLLRDGLRGRAKISAGSRSLGQRLWRYLCYTFRFG